jgi:hypothetical protein
VVHDRVLGVAGGEQHLGAGPAPRDFLGELAAVHAARHDHVGEQEIERLAGL